MIKSNGLKAFTNSRNNALKTASIKAAIKNAYTDALIQQLAKVHIDKDDYQYISVDPFSDPPKIEITWSDSLASIDPYDDAPLYEDKAGNPVIAPVWDEKEIEKWLSEFVPRLDITVEDVLRQPGEAQMVVGTWDNADEFVARPAVQTARSIRTLRGRGRKRFSRY